MAEQRRVAASTQRQTAAHYMSPIPGEYSAGASLPLPPRVPAWHRASFGRPSTPIVSVPFTPLVQRVAAPQQAEADADVDEERHDAADVAAAEEGMPARDTRMEYVRKSMLHSVKPFHGQTAKDTYTVIDWVEKVDVTVCHIVVCVVMCYEC